MQSSRVRMVLLVLVVVGLVLPLGPVGWAQSNTPTPTPALEVATGTATPEQDQIATPTLEETEATPTVAAEDTPEEDQTDAADQPEAAVTPELAAEDATPTEGLDAENPDAEQGDSLAESKSVELTVYNDNRGLVKEVRPIQLLAGENQVRYSDVASLIEPSSVHVVSLTDPEGITLLEQNYEYDLVSTWQLLAKYVDREIVLTTATGSVYTGTLLSGMDDVILSTPEGVVVIKYDKIQEFAFAELPEGLITRPTLVWLIEAAEDMLSEMQVTYLTDGINWRADYIAMLNADDSQLSLNGWVTVDNQSGATYENAKLKLVAGDINRVSEPTPVYKMAESLAIGGASGAIEQRQFFEYHIYQVQRPVTVADRQTKQIEFITAPQVAVTKTFSFEAMPQEQIVPGRTITDPTYGLGADTPVRVMLEFTNSDVAGLGIPLPKGTVRVYKEDVDGSAELVGEDSIDHTPKDEALSLYLGDAFDIVGERKQVSFEQISERVIEEGYEITVRNHKQEDVEVEVIEHLFRAQDAEMLASTLDPEMLAPTTAKFALKVVADGETTLTYTVRYEW